MNLEREYFIYYNIRNSRKNWKGQIDPLKYENIRNNSAELINLRKKAPSEHNFEFSMRKSLYRKHHSHVTVSKRPGKSQYMIYALSWMFAFLIVLCLFMHNKSAQTELIREKKRRHREQHFQNIIDNLSTEARSSWMVIGLNILNNNEINRLTRKHFYWQKHRLFCKLWYSVVDSSDCEWMLKVEDNKEPAKRKIHLDDVWNF